MPFHVVFICIIANGVMSAFLTLGGFAIASRDGLTAGAVMIFVIAGLCGYSAFVVNKMRTYLGEDVQLERELRLARLRAEIAEAQRQEKGPE